LQKRHPTYLVPDSQAPNTAAIYLHLLRKREWGISSRPEAREQSRWSLTSKDCFWTTMPGLEPAPCLHVQRLQQLKA